LYKSEIDNDFLKKKQFYLKEDNFQSFFSSDGSEESNDSSVDQIF
jgi:hypothetical protein